MPGKYFLSFIDDVIWVFRDLTRQRPASLFDNPFFKILKTAHDRYGLKTQLNLFYRTDYFYGMDQFNLSEMTDQYKAEFEEASGWMKLGFHSFQEHPDYPHVNSSYEDIHKLFNMIKQEVIRFAGEKSFAYGVVPHWIPVSYDGCRALFDCGAKLVAVTAGKTREFDGNFSSLPFGHAQKLLQNRTPEARLFTRVTKDVAIANSICSYNHFEDEYLWDNDKVLGYITDKKTGLKFKKVDDNFDLNNYNLQELRDELYKRKNDELICIGNHEQYFYPEFFLYLPDYSDRIFEMARILTEEGRESIFIEDLINMS